ncbi:MAG: M23 family metallopeptidase [Spirochaetota bacterium]|jgi:hypothetical protein|nr:M23 family metallopeptidase [Spirochaetota bacterium]
MRTQKRPLQKMRAAALIAILSISATITGAVFEWPVARVLLTASFGETRSDHFHNGIDMGGDSQRVVPIAPGEIVYYFDEGEHPLYRESGVGNFMVLQHTNAMRSYYYHMRKASVANARASLAHNETIGLSGNSGRSFGAHLHLSVSDDKGYINPLSLLPDYPDARAPEIASILFDFDGRVITVPDQYRVSGLDIFTLLARAWDTHEEIRAIGVLAPYQVSFSLDGNTLKTITFDRLLKKNGRLLLADGTGFAETWSGEGFLIGGELRNLSGQHTISILAADYAGNTASKSVNVQFR